MRVALDVSHTRLAAAGTTRYSSQLLQVLSAQPEVEVLAIGAGSRSLPRSGARRQATVLHQDLVWYPFAGRRAAAAAAADIYHVPVARGPLSHGGPPTVVTVHDLVPHLYPETMSGWNRLYTRSTLARVVHAADLIVCVSRDTADDVSRLLHIPPERIRVVHNGVAHFWFEAHTGRGAEAYAAHEHTGAPYILFVGTPEPRKNLGRLLRAMRLLRQRGRAEKLMIAGGSGWGPSELDPGDGCDVVLTGVVSDERLRDLYARAACVVLPSLHEGFGLPALEAMAAGAPVVVSRVGALPEVCGEAAVYVDPLDVESIANGIERAVTLAGPAPEVRIARAQRFTWQAAAADLVSAYRELL